MPPRYTVKGQGGEGGMEASAVSLGIFQQPSPTQRLASYPSYAQPLSVMKSIREIHSGGWQIFAKDSSKSPSPLWAHCTFVC